MEKLLLRKETIELVKIFLWLVDSLFEETEAKDPREFSNSRVPSFSDWESKYSLEKFELPKLVKLGSFLGIEFSPELYKEIMGEDSGSLSVKDEIYEFAGKLMRHIDKSYTKVITELNKNGDQLPELIEKKIMEFVKENYLDIALEILFFKNMIGSIILYKKPIFLLYSEAKSGNKDSFFKLIGLDKSIITTEWAKERLWRATIESDDGFFKELGKTLRFDPWTKKRKLIKISSVIFLSYPLGFENLTYMEKANFLEAVGFSENEIPGEDTLRQELHRWNFSESWNELFSKISQK